MPTLQIRNQEQVLERMINAIIARTPLTDFTDSSALKHVLAAFAREIDDVYLQLSNFTDLFSLDRAVGEDLDERAKDVQPGTIRRLGPLRASGRIVFSRSSNTGSTIVIPAGAVAKSATGVAYRTTAAAFITGTSSEQVAGHGVGRDSAPVSAVAVVAGEAGNIGVGTVVSFQSTPPGISAVTNTTSFSGGRDQENDDAFRARIKLFIASLARSTVQALEFIAIGVTSDDKTVVFSHVFEDPINRGNVVLYIDDGAGTAADFGAPIVDEVVLSPALGGEEFLTLDQKPIFLPLVGGITVTRTRPGPVTVTLARDMDYFVNPASGELFFPTPGTIIAGDIIKASYIPFAGLIPAVQKIIDGDPADRLNFPGFRPAGVLVRVLAPTVLQQNVEGVLKIKEGADLASVILEAQSAISDYINTLGISGDVIRNEIIDRIMEVDGVVDVNLVLPTENVNILDDQIPRIDVADIDLS